LLAVVAMALALLPGSAAAGAALNQAGLASADLVVDATGAATVAPTAELGRNSPKFKIVCQRGLSGTNRVCYRWAPGRCFAHRSWTGQVPHCVGSGATARAIL
jgi:hypothetical protein